MTTSLPLRTGSTMLVYSSSSVGVAGLAMSSYEARARVEPEKMTVCLSGWKPTLR
ncbi:MAG: hypothetical protein QOE09_1566 [Ilumatobacteraceae bacterium]|jgi:hypothetical protein